MRYRAAAFVLFAACLAAPASDAFAGRWDRRQHPKPALQAALEKGVLGGVLGAIFGGAAWLVRNRNTPQRRPQTPRRPAPPAGTRPGSSSADRSNQPKV